MRSALLFLLCLLIAACSQIVPSSSSATLFIVNNSDQQLCKVNLTSAEGDQLDVLLVNGDQPLESQANVQIKPNGQNLKQATIQLNPAQSQGLQLQT